MNRVQRVASNLPQNVRAAFLDEIREAERCAFETSYRPASVTQLMVGINENGAVYVPHPTYHARRSRGRPPAFVLRTLAFDLQRIFIAYNLPTTLTFGAGTGIYSDWIATTLAVAESVNARLRKIVEENWSGKVTRTSPCGSYHAHILRASPSSAYQACRAARNIKARPWP